MSCPVLQVINLIKTYGKKSPTIAVDNISFFFLEGEILGLLGPNGSGKTTIIQMLLGALSPSAGKIIYFGKDFASCRSEILQEISFASTYTHLPPLLTISENLHVYGKLFGFTRKETERRIDPLLQKLGILPYKYKRVSMLSSGQITRLMLVKALFTSPKILLLDEPTASLDPEVVYEIKELLLEQRKKTNLSILFTSHKMQEVADLCDRVIFLKKGKIVANDLPGVLARNAGAFRLRLRVINDLQKVEALALKRNYAYHIDSPLIEISLTDGEIPPFLQDLTKMDISYASIQIKEPSLEDYFLQMARN